MATTNSRISDAWSTFTDVPSAPGASSPAGSSDDSWLGGFFSGVGDFFSGVADTGLSLWQQVTTTQTQQQQAKAQTALTNAQARSLSSAPDMTPLIIAGGLGIAALVLLRK